jgi:hypothetical protein
VEITFTISGAEGGDTYKIWRSLETAQGSPVYDSLREQGSATNGSNTKYDTLGVITGSDDTYYLQYKIEVYDGGVTLVDSCETSEESMVLDEDIGGEPIQCPE